MSFSKLFKMVGVFMASFGLIAAQTLPVFVLNSSRASAGSISDKNKVSYWCGDGEGVKFDTGAVGTHVDGQVEITISTNDKNGKTEVSDALGNGVSLMKIVVKGGSTGGTGGDGNNVYTPTYSFPLVAPDNNGGQQSDVSHVIVCYEQNATVVKVKKEVNPANAKGNFDLYVNGNRVVQDATYGSESSFVEINPTQNLIVRERPGTDLSNFDSFNTTVSCYDHNSILLDSGSPDGRTSRQFTLNKQYINQGDAITCVFVNSLKKPDVANVEVVKRLVPAQDPGKFNLKINNVTKKANAGNGDSTGPVVVNHSKNVVVKETAANNSTKLSKYQTRIVCRNSNGVVVASGNPSGAQSRSLTINKNKIGKNSKIRCVITNTRKTGTVVVHKSVNNKWGGTNDPSKFSFTVNDGDPTAFESDGTNRLTLPAGATVDINEVEVDGYSVNSDNCSDIKVEYNKTKHCYISNTSLPATLIVKKKLIQDDGAAHPFTDFSFTVNGEGDYSFNDDGVVKLQIPAGTYTVSENPHVRYTTEHLNCSKLDVGVGEEVTCVIVNNDLPPVVVLATKIVCKDEAQLPNWGGERGPIIDEFTAIEWVKNNKSCDIAEGWTFEWALGGTKNPGDNVEEGGPGWNKFEPTDENGEAEAEVQELEGSDRIWVREQLPEGYLGFTFNEEGKKNTNEISAELYCNDDVLNYDNFDYIRNPQYGETYHCVAWNIELGKIRVVKFIDSNGNGIKDEGETQRLRGWEFELYNSNGEKIETRTTGRKGKTTFRHLDAGIYKVCEVFTEEQLTDGWVMTTQNEDNCIEVVVRLGQKSTVRVGNIIPPKVVVTKFIVDVDGHVIEDADGIDGWEMNLCKQHDLVRTGSQEINGEECPHVLQETTDDTGVALFSDIKPGEYELTESKVEGWEVKWIKCGGQDEDFLKFNLIERGAYFYAGHNEVIDCEVGNYDAREIEVEFETTCNNDFPYLSWNVKTTNVTPTEFTFKWYTVDPNNAGDTAGLLVHTETVAVADATFDGVNMYSGMILWPGADVDAPDWPGYSLVDGVWVEDPTDFGGNLRPNALVEVSVNPTDSAVVAYPVATDDCSPSNPQVLSATDELADTGVAVQTTTLFGLLLLVASLVVSRRTANKTN